MTRSADNGGGGGGAFLLTVQPSAAERIRSDVVVANDTVLKPPLTFKIEALRGWGVEAIEVLNL